MSIVLFGLQPVAMWLDLDDPDNDSLRPPAQGSSASLNAAETPTGATLVPVTSPGGATLNAVSGGLAATLVPVTAPTAATLQTP